MTYYAVEVSFLAETLLTVRAVPAETEEEAKAKALDMAEGLREFKVLGVKIEDPAELVEEGYIPTPEVPSTLN